MIDRSRILINITGRRFRCKSKDGTIISSSPDVLKIGRTYLELREDDFGIFIADDSLLIMVCDQEPMYVDAECFELVKTTPIELFLIPITQN